MDYTVGVIQMKIKQIAQQYRRDFRAIYECHCGHTQTGSGYDDKYFREEVIPAMKCEKCGQTNADCTDEYRPLTTKYEEGVQV